MTRATLLALLLLAAPPSLARAGEDGDTCRATVAGLRVRAAALPGSDLSRYMAERELDNALRELIAGDVDDCEGMAEHAAQVIETRPYALRPGEALQGYGPDGPLLVSSQPAGPALADPSPAGQPAAARR